MITPPVQTREQKLPFNELAWQYFEKLCLRLVRLDQSVEHTQSYGVQGDAQGGIDIYARHRDNFHYTVYQCKNEQDFGPAKIKKAVDVFLGGEWAKTSAVFVLCTRESLDPKNRADAIEVQAKRLRKRDIAFLVWDEGKLCALLKDNPAIVDDFFGRPWVNAFCGEEAAERLGNRITAQQSETALGAYYSWLTEKIGRVVYRGFASHSRDERNVELPLEDVYIEPLLLPENDLDAHRMREREIILQLQDADIDAVHQAKLELEFRDIKMSDWQIPHITWDDGWATIPPAAHSPINPVTLQEVLAKENRAVILGAPGSGKSTLLRWLALLCVRSRLYPEQVNLVSKITADTQIFPVFVSLAAFANALKSQSSLTLLNFIQMHLQSLGIQDLERLYESKFQRGTCWILLDGIDEIAEASVRADVVKAIESFLPLLGDNRCLLTSRLHGYERVAGIPHYHLQSLNTKQISDFIFSWNFSLEVELNLESYNLYRGRECGESLISQLIENENLSALASNPLLLVALLLMHRQNQRLPQSRVEIYHAMTQTLLETWNVWRSEVRYNSGGQILTALQLRRVLAKVAIWSRREKPRGILRRGELQRRFVMALEELQFETDDLEQTAQSYLNAAIEQAGLIEERAPGIFAFWHPTFEEFLAAYELVSPPNQAAQKLLPLRGEPYWREVILLAVGLIGIVNEDRDVASDLVRVLARTNVPIFEPILHSALRLGIACIAETPSLDRNLIQELLCELVQALTHQPYEPMAGSFLEVAAALPNFKPNKQLVEALGQLAVLHHSLGEVREYAYRLLANVAANNPRAEQLCLEKFQRNLDENYMWKDIMSRFYATIGCMRSGHCEPFALCYLTGTTKGIFHISRAVELLDLDQSTQTTNPNQRRKNLELVHSVLNQPFTSPDSTVLLPEEKVGEIIDSLSAALLLLFAGDRSRRVFDIFEETLKPKYDLLGVIFDAAHAPLIFGFEDEQDTIKLQRQALVAFRRWFKHKTPERRLHAANEVLNFLESWEERYGSYIEQAPEFEGRVETAKTEKFVEAYSIDRHSLNKEALYGLKSCLHAPDIQTRFIAADFLLKRGQVKIVAKAVEKWINPVSENFHPFAATQIVSKLSETPEGKETVLGWMRGDDDWLKALSSGAMVHKTQYKLEAINAKHDCLSSPHDEIRSAVGGTLAFFAFTEDKPLAPAIETALRSCLGSINGDASRNAAAVLYRCGFLEEELLTYLAEYMTTQEVGERFATLRAFQEHNTEIRFLEGLAENIGQLNPASHAAMEKIQTKQVLNERDIFSLSDLVNRKDGENHEAYLYRRCIYDWVWLNLEEKALIKSVDSSSD